MANIIFIKTKTPSSITQLDGQIIFDTSGTGKIYIDDGGQRIEVGGAKEGEDIVLGTYTIGTTPNVNVNNTDEIASAIGKVDATSKASYNGVTVESIANLAENQNYIPFPYYDFPSAKTGLVKNGVTMKVDGAGRITLSGTATADTSFILTYYQQQIVLPTYNGQYLAKAIGKSLGSNQNVYLRVKFINSSGTTTATYYDGTAFTAPSSSYFMQVELMVKNGTAIGSGTQYEIQLTQAHKTYSSAVAGQTLVPTLYVPYYRHHSIGCTATQYNAMTDHPTDCVYNITT